MTPKRRNYFLVFLTTGSAVPYNNQKRCAFSASSAPLGVIPN